MRVLILGLVLALIVPGCKKGPDDPGLPFKSRKKRITGDWHMSSGAASFTGANYNELFSLDGSAFKNYRTYPGGQPTIYVGKYSLSLDVHKDGTFAFNEISPYGLLTGVGEWNFNSGVGDEKKKESITLLITSLSKGNSQYGFFNHASNVMHYRLKELSNKKMVMFSSGMYYTADDFPVTYQLDYTLEQRE